jgi:hypothetical protein
MARLVLTVESTSKHTASATARHAMAWSTATPRRWVGGRLGDDDDDDNRLATGAGEGEGAPEHADPARRLPRAAARASRSIVVTRRIFIAQKNV